MECWRSIIKHREDHSYANTSYALTVSTLSYSPWMILFNFKCHGLELSCQLCCTLFSKLHNLSRRTLLPSFSWNSQTCTAVIYRVNYHKHLALTLSCDGTWHNHIQNSIAPTKKILESMEALKLKLHRKTLNHIYLSYLRPHLEYGSIVQHMKKSYYKSIASGLTRSV